MMKMSFIYLFIYFFLELGWQGKWIWFGRLLQGCVCSGEFKEVFMLNDISNFLIKYKTASMHGN